MADAENQTRDYEDLSDEELMNIDPATAGISAPEMDHAPQETLEDKLDAAAEEDTVQEEPAGEEPPAGEAVDPDQPEETGDQPGDDEAEDGDAEASQDDNHTTPHQPEDKGEGDEGEDGDTPKETEAKGPENFEDLYKEVMAPFKANGKEFAPSSVDEAKRLMQMGANYTKKMQHLAPNLKLMRMLENNNLLDESKLNFLIDLERKDPQAIQKLLHDGKIDPLDLDTSSEPAYKPGNHSVSDQEMAFHDVLGNVMSTPTGKETVSHINSQWDQDSKQAIYREPQLMQIIDEQRSNGVYAKIAAEIDRRRVLGELQNVPFIAAYKEVGDALHAEGKLHPEGASPQGNPASAPAQRPVLDTRPAARRPSVSNGDKARAISSAPRAGKAATPAPLDPFSMTDEEIMSMTSLKV